VPPALVANMPHPATHPRIQLPMSSQTRARLLCGCPAVASRVFNVSRSGHSPPPAALNHNSAAVTPVVANHTRPANIHAHPPTLTFTLAHVHARTVCAPDCRTACVQCIWCDVCTRCQRSPSAALNRNSAAVTSLVANHAICPPTHPCLPPHSHPHVQK
jgi:hypothetical protein